MKKWKYIGLFFVLSILILLFILYPKASAITNDLQLFGRVIFVDAGHGGRDSGTTYGKLLEKDINLEISKVLEEELVAKGAIVYMTRDEDEDLSSKWDEKKKRGDLYRRLLLYKKYHAELYLSIHLNYGSNPRWSGAEVLYHPINPLNEKLGTILMKNFKNDFKTKRSLKKTDLYMYKNTTIPGVLIECGFLSNANERYLLQKEDYQRKIAKTITNSVIEFFEQEEFRERNMNED